MGGAKGGADFDPKGKSDNEVRRFCQSFMTELYRHIGQFTDVPAGDIGVGSREIGYLFGQHKRITNEFTGALTGKGPTWGGSLIRSEATGFGVVYFAQEMLATRGMSLAGARCLVSGSGNVALYTAAKLIDVGAVPITLSDSDGFVVDPAGIGQEKLQWVLELKNVRRGRIREYADRFPGAVYTPAVHADHNPLWAVPADYAFPSATQNEIGATDAQALVDNGIRLVAEGANMPTRPEGARDLPGGGHPVRAEQGRQRRGGRGVRPGDGPGRRAPALAVRAGGCSATVDRRLDPRPDAGRSGRVRPARGLCRGGQCGRVPQGGGRHDRRGRHLRVDARAGDGMPPGSPG